MENSESDGASDDSGLRESILFYLHQNPSAADSLGGIKNWWLPEQYKETHALKIEDALQQLVTDGLVKKASLVDGTVIYKQSTSRNRDRAS